MSVQSRKGIGELSGAKIRQRQNTAGVRRFHYPLGGTAGGPVRTQGNTEAAAGGSVREQQRKRTASIVKNLGIDGIASINRQAECLAGFRVHLVPGVVNTFAVRAIRVGAGLFDAIAAVAINSDPR